MSMSAYISVTKNCVPAISNRKSWGMWYLYVSVRPSQGIFDSSCMRLITSNLFDSVLDVQFCIIFSMQNVGNFHWRNVFFPKKYFYNILQVMCYCFSISSERYAEQVNPLLVQAQRKLISRIASLGGKLPPQPHFVVSILVLLLISQRWPTSPTCKLYGYVAQLVNASVW